MKKVSICSLLFALLLALNVSHIKADAANSIVSKLVKSNRSLFLLGTTAALGISGLLCFKDSWKWRNTRLSKNDIGEFRHDHTPALNANKKTEPLNEAKIAFRNSVIAGISGAICLTGAGISGYALWKMIK